MDYGVSLSMESVDNISKHKVSYWLYVGIKRVFDIFCALCGLIVLLPLSIIVKIAYVITGDFNSIFYKQVRIGKNGKQFYMYKYRSMVKDADKILEELLKQKEYKEEWDQNQKLHDDPRITKMGKFLRKTSLDEVPQFINVFKGDMSLIGPRPLVPGELDKHNGNHNIYERVRPGITSNWAVNGRSDEMEYTKRLKLEYDYVLNRSIAFDLKIIFKTIAVVILRKGAK
jgi:undecaprenyl-phosphate galactose phosphotransferase